MYIKHNGILNRHCHKRQTNIGKLNETGEVQNTSKDVTSNESNTDGTHDKRKHG